MRTKIPVLVMLLGCLVGCYPGSVKPLLNRSDFKSENEPVRTLKVLLVTDNTHPKDKIEKFISECSSLIEMQVGIRLAIVDWQQIKWEGELDDIIKMDIRISADTWSKKEKFDIVITFVGFAYNIADGKLPLGATDTFFWRYIFVGEIDPFILLHELFHTFLLRRDHSEEWVMRSARPDYGEWHWLSVEDRKEVLRNKWRDFNVMPATGRGDIRSRESWFYYKVGRVYIQRRQFDRAILLFNKSLETNPKYAAAYETRGTAYSQKEQYDQAISDFNRALEINPGFAEAYFSRGMTYWIEKEYDRSWEDIKKAQDLGYKIPAKFLRDLRQALRRQD